jgi:hypothetical protein
MDSFSLPSESLRSSPSACSTASKRLVRSSKRDIAQLTVGEAALDESDHFIYDSTTGGLFFDADGTGISEAIQVAQLSSGFETTQSGFLAVVLVLLILLL